MPQVQTAECGEKICGFGKNLHVYRVKFMADFEYDVSFDHTGVWSALRAGDHRIIHLLYFRSAVTSSK